MSARSPEDTVEVLKAFHKGMEQGGFIDSRNVNIEYRWARGDYSRLPVLATELIGRHIDVLVATGGNASARVEKEATSRSGSTLHEIVPSVTLFGALVNPTYPAAGP